VKNLLAYPRIILAAAFFGLMIFAAHEKCPLFALGFAVATWIIARNHTSEERLQHLNDAARDDANTYRERWQLECKRHALENPTEKPKKPTDYKLH